MKDRRRPAPPARRKPAKFSQAPQSSGPARRQRPSNSDSKPRGERPLREDLVTQAALEAWGAIDHEGRLADRALDFTLRHKKNLYSSERRAVAERVYALLRRRRTVDWLLAHALPSFEALPTTHKDMLRFGGSRVLHGDNAAMVAKHLGLSGAEANALFELPNAARALEKLPDEERFPIAASLPDFLAERFKAEFGKDADAAAEAMNERAPLNARVNTLKGTREELMQRLVDEGVNVRACKLSDLGVELDTRINAFSLKTFQDGFFELQDEGSQLLGMLVDPPPTKVVDACAGAGGKTLQLAGDMKNRGELFALDIDEHRVEELRRRARRAGVHNARTRVIASDDTAREQITDLVGKADRVLVDAPCSGTGTFRRKPDARYRLEEADLAMHVDRQKALLERFCVMVKPGGRLIYGTCSVLRAENEDVIEEFLSRHPEFSVRPVAEELGEALGKKVSRDGFLRLFPHVHGTDGFFGAILVRAKV